MDRVWGCSLLALLVMTFVLQAHVQLPGVEALPANKTAFALLPKVNAEGPYLGLIVPNGFEFDPFLAPGIFVPHPTIPYLDLAGRRFYVGTIEGKKVIPVLCGLGMLNAGITTQQLLDFFDISGVLHYGIAGSSNNALDIGDVSIPKYWAHTGLWYWQRYGDGLDTPLSLESAGDYTRKLGALQIGNYNVPKGEGKNLLNNIFVQPEEVYATTGTPEIRAHYFFVEVNKHYLSIAKKLEGLKLASCSNGTCLDYVPKVTVGLKGGSANIFVDNAAFRSFIFDQFDISSVDEESAAVALNCLTNNVPFIAFRSLSDLAGGTAAANQITTFTSLAADNAILVLQSFIKLL